MNEINKYIKFKKNFTELFLIILFLGYFLQSTYVFLGVNLTMPLTIVIFVAWGINFIKYKYIGVSQVYLIIGIFMSLFLFYTMDFFNMYYVRICLNIALFGIIFYSIDINTILKHEIKIRNSIYCYFIINLMLYISKNPLFFKDINIEKSLRFKGLMPDANALASLCLFLMIISIISLKYKKKILPMVLMFLIILTTGSRGNTIVGLVIILINLLKLNTIYKIIPIGLASFFAGPYISSMDIFYRFSSIGLRGNNRDILYNIAMYEFNISSLFEKVTGIGLSDRYVIRSSNIWWFPYHDFAENTYISMLMLFGISGLILLALIILSMIYEINRDGINMKSNMIMCTLLLILSKQDIILSTQLWMTFVIGIKILSIKYKERYIEIDTKES